MKIDFYFDQRLSLELDINYKHSSRPIAEGELQFPCQEKNSIFFQQQFPPSSQPDVGPEGEAIEQVEGEVHSDHRRICSVFQERFGSAQSNGRFSFSGG